MERVVIDANVFFAPLIAASDRVRNRLENPGDQLKFYCPKFVFVEVFKYKAELLRKTSLTAPDLLSALNAVVNAVEFRSEESIRLEYWMEAHRLCKGIDEKDAPYVALALELDAKLWTRDNELRNGLKRRGFDRFYEN